MKKIFAISFLFIYLLSTTELSQFLKVPLLAEHFIEHREENKHFTLWQFLYIHYAMENVKDADYEKDMKLPFKSHDKCVANFTTVYLPVSKVAIENPILFLEKKSFKSKDQFLLPSFLANIWQPPRIC